MARNGRVSSATTCAGFRARRAASAITRLYDRFLEPSGLTSSQFAVLATLYLEGTTTMHELAERLGVDPSTMTRAVGALERDGLVRTERASMDQRARRVALSAKGRRRVTAARPHWEAAQAELRRRIGGQRFERLIADLGVVVEALSSETAQEKGAKKKE